MRILSTGVEEYKEFLKKPSREIDRVKEDIALRTKILEERGKTFDEKNRTLEDQTKALGEKIKGIEDRFKVLEEKIKATSNQRGPCRSERSLYKRRRLIQGCLRDLPEGKCRRGTEEIRGISQTVP
jgi:chromosome segregation ATPase